MLRIYCILITLILYNPSVSHSQDGDSTHITVSGKAFEAGHRTQPLIDLMIINVRTQQGFFGKDDGTFTAHIENNDTLIIASTGYASQKLCFRDSTSAKRMFYIEIPLQKLSIQLQEVQIISPRDIETIEKDIQKLGYKKEDYQLSGIDAFNSPITFLYQEFSGKEQRLRHGMEFIDKEKQRALLKELLQRYVSGNIIQLKDEEFDAFIDYAQVPEQFMKTATQYEFIVYIKNKFKLYSALKEGTNQAK